MNKASRAERRQRSHRPFSSGSSGPLSRPSGDLAAALVTAAETAAAPDPTLEQDPGEPTSAPVDRRDPPPTSLADARPQGRPHLEDDFFARGEESASLQPASYDAPGDEHEQVARRRVEPGIVERRARLRRIVGSVIGGAAFLTVIVGAKACITHSSAAPIAESSLSVPSRVVPSIALQTAQAAEATPSAADPAFPPADESKPAETPSIDVRTSHRLPVVDVEIPPAPDAATDRAWETAAASLSARDFKGADEIFAELARRADTATREAARLARAAWWIANGKQAEVRPVLSDLAARATTPLVQRQARELLLTN